MKLAIIGSRNIVIKNLEQYLPCDIKEIISGGAPGIDRIAAEYAKKENIPLIEFLPDYRRYKRGAPLIRNQQIAEYADEALVFWNGQSNGTKYTIKLFQKLNKKITVIIIANDERFHKKDRE